VSRNEQFREMEAFLKDVAASPALRLRPA
jgi:hypothetical protein